MAHCEAAATQMGEKLHKQKALRLTIQKQLAVCEPGALDKALGAAQDEMDQVAAKTPTEQPWAITTSQDETDQVVAKTATRQPSAITTSHDEMDQVVPKTPKAGKFTWNTGGYEAMQR